MDADDDDHDNDHADGRLWTMMDDGHGRIMYHG